MFSLKFIVQCFSCHILGLFFVASAALLLGACDLATNYTKVDRASNMEFQDFRDGLSERLPEVEGEGRNGSSAAASIPELQPYVSTTPATMKSMPLVSVSVNQTVPIKDILYELAQQAEYDIELDPNIRGSIIFTARNKPFDVVVERISQMAGLRYKFEDSFLRVELDKPYMKTYKIDYLSFIRSNKGGVTTNVSVVSGEGTEAGSSYQASSESQSDFWGELEAGLQQILGDSSDYGLKTDADPRITAAEQNPDVAPIVPEQNSEGGVDVQPPEVVLNVESLPVDDVPDDGLGGMEQDDKKDSGTYSINKQAGMINVYASEKVHKSVGEYLSDLRRSVTSQVLVEAKVFEVSLKDEYVNGIEWAAVTENGKGAIRLLEAAGGSVIGTITSPGGSVATVSNFSAGYAGADVGAFIEAISGFGTVRALASPRLTVLNNQSAVLNVATNRVFFEIDISRETDDDTGDVTLDIDSDIKSVPEGVLINVQPSINVDDRTVSMFIRPTITRIVGTQSDPGILFIAGDSGITSDIPELNVQEIDTVVKVNSGQPIVMGGLLQDDIRDTQEAIPVLGEVPILGAAFRKQNDLVSKTELVIFLKATIVDSADQTIHNTDRDLYRAFSGDRRPFKL